MIQLLAALLVSAGSTSDSATRLFPEQSYGRLDRARTCELIRRLDLGWECRQDSGLYARPEGPACFGPTAAGTWFLVENFRSVSGDVVSVDPGGAIRWRRADFATWDPPLASRSGDSAWRRQSNELTVIDAQGRTVLEHELPGRIWNGSYVFSETGRYFVTTATAMPWDGSGNELWCFDLRDGTTREVALGGCIGPLTNVDAQHVTAVLGRCGELPDRGRFDGESTATATFDLSTGALSMPIEPSPGVPPRGADHDSAGAALLRIDAGDPLRTLATPDEPARAARDALFAKVGLTALPFWVGSGWEARWGPFLRTPVLRGGGWTVRNLRIPPNVGVCWPTQTILIVNAPPACCAGLIAHLPTPSSRCMTLADSVGAPTRVTMSPGGTMAFVFSKGHTTLVDVRAASVVRTFAEQGTGVQDFDDAAGLATIVLADAYRGGPFATTVCGRDGHVVYTGPWRPEPPNRVVVVSNGRFVLEQYGGGERGTEVVSLTSGARSWSAPTLGLLAASTDRHTLLSGRYVGASRDHPTAGKALIEAYDLESAGQDLRFTRRWSNQWPELPIHWVVSPTGRSFAVQTQVRGERYPYSRLRLLDGEGVVVLSATHSEFPFNLEFIGDMLLLEGSSLSGMSDGSSAGVPTSQVYVYAVP